MDFTQDQEDELMAIAAIWPGFSTRKGVWGGKSFAVIVTPLGIPETEAYAKVTVVISYVNKYPRNPPSLELESAINLSVAEVKELKCNLENLARSLVGDRVFVHDLLSETAEFLSRITRPPNRSLWEQMHSEEKRASKVRDAEQKFEEELMIREENNEQLRNSPPTENHWNQSSPAKKFDLEGSYLIQKSQNIVWPEDSEYPDLCTPEGSDVNSDDTQEKIQGYKGIPGRSSWYKSQFKEIGKIGKGGFGTVFKVRNRVDKRFYAMKKIPLDMHDKLTNSKIRREVTTISRMIHNNIVRYYHAVMEDDGDQINVTDTILEEDTDSSSSKGHWNNFNRYDMHFDEDSAGVDFETDITESVEKHEKKDSFESKSPNPPENKLIKSRKAMRQERRKSKTMKKFDHKKDPFDDNQYPMDQIVFEEILNVPGPITTVGYSSSSSSSTISDDDSGSSSSTSNSNISWLSLDNNGNNRVIESRQQLLMLEGEEFGEFFGSYKENKGAVGASWSSEEALKSHFSRERSNLPPLRGQFPLSASPNVPYRHVNDPPTGAPIKSFEDPQIPKTSKRAQILYIQMEYCEDTLRGVMDNGQLWNQPNEVWRLFRQIVNAVEFIHRKGTIHRDLKPPNIFIDRTGNVKVGDFGLATMKHIDNPAESLIVKSNTLLKENGHSDSSLMSEFELAGSNMSAGVGTVYYRAPEQESCGKYGSKADMWSLGILLFEMLCRPFTTLMERAEVMMSLRKHTTMQSDNNSNDIHDAQFPTEFDSRVPASTKEVIRWLLKKDPASRPSSTELLKSSLLPPQIEVETSFLREALTCISNPHSSSYSHIVRALFEQGTTEHIERTYDDSSLRSLSEKISASSLTSNTVTLQSIANVLQYTFETHGAIPLDIPLIFPRPPNFDSRCHGSRPPLTLMDNKGTVVMVANEFTTPFARFVAWRGVTNIKRYQIGQVRWQIPSEPHFTEVTEASFDIISSDSSSSNMPEVLETESILVTARAMSAFAPYLGPWQLRIGSPKLTGAILDLCGFTVSNENRDVRASIWKLFGVSSWSIRGKSFQNKLLVERLKSLEAKGLSKNVINRIRPFLSMKRYSDDPFEVLDQIEALIQSSQAAKNVMLPTGRYQKQRNATPLYTLDESSRTGLSHREALRVKKALRIAKESLDGLRALLDSLARLGLLVTANKKEEPLLGVKLDRERGESGALELACLENITIDLSIGAEEGVFSEGLKFYVAVRKPKGFQYSNYREVSRVLTDDDNRVGQIENVEDSLISLAEGGRFDDLISQYSLRLRLRPPKFDSQMQIAIGVRFSIDLIATLVTQSLDKTGKSRSIAPPGAAYWQERSPVEALVCNGTGFHDSDNNIRDRLIVAAHLWNSDIRCDYLPLDRLREFVKHSRTRTGMSSINVQNGSESLLLDQLSEACLRAFIPFLVVVKPHLLRQKGCVKIISISSNASSQDEMVSLTSMGTYIQDQLHRRTATSIRDKVDCYPGVNKTGGKPIMTQNGANSWQISVGDIRVVPVEWGVGLGLGGTLVSHLNALGKKAYKDFSAVEMRVKSLVEAMKCPLDGAQLTNNISHTGHHVGPVGPVVLTCDVPFLNIREFNTTFMIHSGSSRDIQSLLQNSAFKKQFRYLLDVYEEINRTNISVKIPIRQVFVYSVPDDMMDLLSFSGGNFKTRGGNKG